MYQTWNIQGLGPSRETTAVKRSLCASDVEYTGLWAVSRMMTAINRSLYQTMEYTVLVSYSYNLQVMVDLPVELVCVNSRL